MRRPFRDWRKILTIGKMLRAVSVAGLAGLAAPALAWEVPDDCIDGIADAGYTAPTTRYPHGALGDDTEWGGLSITLRLKPPCEAGGTDAVVTLPQELVFEDVLPRLWDLTGDGAPEVVVVESHADKGARLAVWGLGDGAPERLAATDFIGQRFRWLAPVGAADLDGDGAVEVAFVDRPHLAKVLRVFRWQDGQLVEVASEKGLTNHHFGSETIEGGLRDCEGRPELLLADSGWRNVIAVRLTQGRLERRVLGPITGPDSLEDARTCR